MSLPEQAARETIDTMLADAGWTVQSRAQLNLGAARGVAVREFALNVQRLTSNTIDPVSNVCITTIQRLYSILSGEVALDEANEEQSLFEAGDMLGATAREVPYNRAVKSRSWLRRKHGHDLCRSHCLVVRLRGGGSPRTPSADGQSRSRPRR